MTKPYHTKSVLTEEQQPQSTNSNQSEAVIKPDPAAPLTERQMGDLKELLTHYAPFSYDKNLDQIFKPVEIAAILGVKVETVWAWCRSGKLPHLRLSKRAFRVRSADLQDFLRSVTH